MTGTWRLVPMAALLAVAGPLWAEGQRVEVTGEGRVAAAPDMATVRLGVEARAPSPGDAVAAMGDGMGPVLAAVEAAGIEQGDVQTGQLSLRPVHSERPYDGDDGPEIEGYVAVTIVSVRVEDLSGLGALLDDLVGIGANRLDGIAFGLSDPTAVRDAALEAAVEDAQSKAALLARAAGVTLGAVEGIVEQGGNTRPMAMMMADAAERGSVPIAPGEMEISANVRMTFLLEP